MPTLPESSRLHRQIEFIVEVDRLKEVLRRNVLTVSRRRENDAEHSWHLCLCVLVLAEHADAPRLDVLRVLKMLILHDLVEIDAGDTFAYDTAGASQQHEREGRAAERIFGLLPDEQARDLRAIWNEFEARQTPEAIFAAAVDRFQPMLLNSRTDGHSWREHDVNASQVMARGTTIREASTSLWEYVAEMIREAVSRGHLADG